MIEITPEGSAAPVFLDTTPVVPVEEPVFDRTLDDVRREQYELRSDPLFFKWKRGAATEQEWLDEVAAIKAEFPDPDE